MDKPHVGADIPASSTHADISLKPEPNTAPVPLPSLGEPRGQYSPDGRWWWNGAQWVPVQAAAPGPAVCQVCGGTPAIPVEFKSVVALVVFGITSTFRGIYCRDCGLANFRKRMSATLLTGWWGFIHFFINLYAIVTNLSARTKLMALAPPTRDPAASFLSPGRPVFLRPGFLISAAVAAVLIAYYTVSAITPPQPFPAADQELVGSCAMHDGKTWSPTDCSATHAGKVVSLAHSKYGCASQLTPVKIDDGNYLCIDTTK
jgi:hypothetical protein